MICKFHELRLTVSPRLQVGHPPHYHTEADEESSQKAEGPEALVHSAAVGAGGWSKKAILETTISLRVSWVRTRQSGSGCMQGAAGKINGYVISLRPSQIGSSGGRRSRAEKRSIRNEKGERGKKRESKPDRKVRPDQAPTHPHAAFPRWRHRGVLFACPRCNPGLLPVLGQWLCHRPAGLHPPAAFSFGPASPVNGSMAASVCTAAVPARGQERGPVYVGATPARRLLRAFAAGK